MLYQIHNGCVDIFRRLQEYYSFVHNQSEHVHDSIIIIVLYDKFLEKIALDVLIFALLLGFESRLFALMFIIWANFFLNETFFDLFQKTLFGFGGDILSRVAYSSTVGVKSS